MPSLPLLIALDVASALVAFVLGVIMFIAWWSTRKQKTYVLAMAMIYLAISGRLQSIIYIRLLVVNELSGFGNEVWRWMALISEVVLVTSLLFEFWQILKDEIKHRIKEWFR